ncbi:hypothetical protein L873DRAFT_1679898 [Choiromyces venosus 120613-1]|uniref:VIT-domain-containing protein n=1 Tax=Choiromyces venosus 120613-1 TaxID=1336337 RepID=A0A3N4K3M9_9PEZI|nr:hypothetical protein L873DRAFT_1679898 [Choiromyces venosus 120613-1]
MPYPSRGPYDDPYHGFTDRDFQNESGIYFKRSYIGKLPEQQHTKRDNTFYTQADYQMHVKEKEKPKEKEPSGIKPPSTSQTVTAVANLPLVRVSYKAQILTTTTRTVLTQTFRHPGNAPIDEATYSFPLYANSSVVSFVCHVGPAKIITGVVQPKKIAKATYEKAKSQGHTAGLLEEFTPEIFKTSLGNIPGGVTVKVEITYLTELKHDTMTDGIRFTVPTSIAPRYEDAPEELFGDKYEARAEEGVSFSIDVTMGERIRTIESPSHRVSVQIGNNTATTKRKPKPANQYNDKKALVTLSQKSMHLKGDFVLLVTTATPQFLCTPMALLEAHPTIPGQRALMVTLVPRLTDPKSPRSQKPEIVFIVDQSGSMESMVAPLKSAMSVFIKSLPRGCKFNICSFGSDYSFLWEKSQDYSRHSVKAAQKHVDILDAKMGGTELLQPIQETVKRRLEDMNTEVIVLTDGEIWEEKEVLEFIKKATGDSNGKLRFFSIGLGSEVSHSLVEGIARIGGGYSQIVADSSDEQDNGGWEGKVVKMLKAALTKHVDHYSLKVIHEGFHESDEEDSDEEEPTPPPATHISAANAPKITTEPQAPKKFSLFDPNENLDLAPGAPPSDDEFALRGPTETAYPTLSEEDRFSHLKKLKTPKILQAPYQIPQLYSQVRAVVYLLISPTGDRFLRNPTSVKLQGTTVSGAEMEQSIPITRLDEPGLTIHQLAARTALRDLEDGSSWLHSGKYGIDPKDETFQEYVEREGESLALKWGLASKWTSFVAVEEEFLEKEAAEKAAAKDNAKKKSPGEDMGDSESDDDDGGNNPSAEGSSNAGTLESTTMKTSDIEASGHGFGNIPPERIPIASIAAMTLVKTPAMGSRGRGPGAFNVMHAGHDSMSMLLQSRDEVADDDWNQMAYADEVCESYYPESSSFGETDDSIDVEAAATPPPTCPPSYPEGRYVSHISTSPVPVTGHITSRILHPDSIVEDNEIQEELNEGGDQEGEHLQDQQPSPKLEFYDTIPDIIPCSSISWQSHHHHASVPESGSESGSESEPPKIDTPRKKVVKIICLQDFMGSFPVTEEMAHLIGLEISDVEGLTKELFSQEKDKVTDNNKVVAMTALVVAYLELEMHEHEDTWQMVVEKARAFVEEGCEVGVEVLMEKAEGVIEEKVLKVCFLSHILMAGTLLTLSFIG